MTPSQLFQKQYGERWAAIAHGPELTGALLAVNAPLFNEIISLTPEQINASGNVILAQLQGQLKHERALIDLSIVHPVISSDLQTTYPNPEDDLEEQADTQDQQTGGSPFNEWIAEADSGFAAHSTEHVIKPKPKRKRKKKKTAK